MITRSKKIQLSSFEKTVFYLPEISVYQFAIQRIVFLFFVSVSAAASVPVGIPEKALVYSPIFPNTDFLPILFCSDLSFVGTDLLMGTLKV